LTRVLCKFVDHEMSSGTRLARRCEMARIIRLRDVAALTSLIEDIAASAKCLPPGHTNAAGLLPHYRPRQPIIPGPGSPGLTIEDILCHTLPAALDATPYRFSSPICPHQNLPRSKP
jgi:hypothetical protein